MEPHTCPTCGAKRGAKFWHLRQFYADNPKASIRVAAKAVGCAPQYAQQVRKQLRASDRVG